ncbi:MAG: CopD family protein [Candidatus Geothermarchaeales archaeon]
MPDYYNIVLGWVHVFAVIAVVGGSVFSDRILQPSLQSISPDQAGKLFEAVAKRFTALVWLAIITIAATGLLRADYFGALTTDILLRTTYGTILLTKMVLFAAMIIIALIITMIGLRLAKPLSQEYVKQAQTRIKILSRTNIVLSIIVVLLAVALRVGV